MKYFTSEWWSSGCDDENVFDQYEKYFSSISSKLPDQIIDFEYNHTLHDANVKNIECDFLNRSVILKLLGWDNEFENQVLYSLKFSDVTHFKQKLPQEENVEVELGDLGYHEYELTDNGIEIRMLFATSAEFTINFTGFEFSHALLE